MTITGTIILIENTKEYGANAFKKRLIVVSTDEQYSQDIPIEFVQDKCAILDNYKLEQKVKVSINIRGNEYNGRYYVNLQGWRIEAAQQAATPTVQTPNEYNPDNLPNTEQEPLPF